MSSVAEQILTRVDDRTRQIVAARHGTPSRRRRAWLLHRSLAVADIAGVALAFALSLSVLAALPEAPGQLHVLEESLLFVVSLPLWVVAFKLKGLYDKDEDQADYSTIDDLTGVFVVITCGTWFLVMIHAVTNLVHPSMLRLTVFWITAVLAIPLARALARSWARTKVAYTQNVLIVGTGPVGRLFARKILAHPEYGLHLVGFVDPDGSRSRFVGSLPVLGTPGELPELVEQLAIDRVILSFTSDSPEESMKIVRGIRDQTVQIDIVPRLYEVVGMNSTVHLIEGTPLVGLPRLRLSPSSRFLKRSLDLMLAITSLAFLLPVFLVIAVAIKLESRGPVFFRQVRRGEGETVFRIFKFRSMVSDAEVRKSEVAHLNMHLSDDPRMFKVPDDPRITRVGAFLRRSSMDELPQLLNVLKGEMSLVGPRPLILEEDQHVVDWQRKRLSIKPGITGLWQVLGRSDIPFDEMTKLDYMYVTSWSLKQDIRLILLTVPSLFRPRSAL